MACGGHQADRLVLALASGSAATGLPAGANRVAAGRETGPARPNRGLAVAVRTPEGGRARQASATRLGKAAGMGNVTRLGKAAGMGNVTRLGRAAGTASAAGMGNATRLDRAAGMGNVTRLGKAAGTASVTRLDGAAGMASAALRPTTGRGAASPVPTSSGWRSRTVLPLTSWMRRR